MDGATRPMTSEERRNLIAERSRVEEAVARKASQRAEFNRLFGEAARRLPCVITVTHSDENRR